jgi:hypothetical protein
METVRRGPTSNFCKKAGPTLPYPVGAGRWQNGDLSGKKERKRIRRRFRGKRRAGAQCLGFSSTRDRNPVPENRMPEGPQTLNAATNAKGNSYTNAIPNGVAAGGCYGGEERRHAQFGRGLDHLQRIMGGPRQTADGETRAGLVSEFFRFSSLAGRVRFGSASCFEVQEILRQWHCPLSAATA